MAASNTRFTQNSLGQSKTPIDSDHGIYRDRKALQLHPSRPTSAVTSVICELAERLHVGGAGK